MCILYITGLDIYTAGAAFSTARKAFLRHWPRDTLWLGGSFYFWVQLEQIGERGLLA